MKTSARIGVAGGGLAATVALALPLVAAWEGLRLSPYKDLVGRPTWCFGETVGTPKANYTKPECEAMLQRSLAKYAGPVLDCLPADAPLSVKAAFSSLAYNAGAAAVCGSTAAKRANGLDYAGACDGLLAWNKITVVRQGKKVKIPAKGLTNRRHAERKLCLSGLP
jgi:lysozyme